MIYMFFTHLNQYAYAFKPVAFEVHGAVGPSTEIFLNKLCKNLCMCTEEPTVGIFLSRESPSQYRLRRMPMYSELSLKKPLKNDFLFKERREQNRSSFQVYDTSVASYQVSLFRTLPNPAYFVQVVVFSIGLT